MHLQRSAEHGEDVILDARDDALAQIEERAAQTAQMQRVKPTTQEAVLDSEHSAVLHSSGKAVCITCSQNADACLRDRRHLRSPLLASNGGVNQDGRLVKLWRDHE